MINCISKIIAKWLLRAGAISAEDLDLYIYGIYSFLFTLIPLFLVILLSIPFNMTSEGVLLIIPFILLRKFSGGFHFKSATPCAIVSILLLLFFLIGTKYVLFSQTYILFYILVCTSLVTLILFSPIDSENRRLSQNEKYFFHKTAVYLSLTFFVIIFIFFAFSLERIAIPIGAGVILSALLQFPCIVKNIYYNRKKH